MKRLFPLLVFMCIATNILTAEDPWWKKLPRQSWSRFQPVKQSQDWFEVYQVRPGVFAIYESGQWEEVISYLIVGSKKALLFDTGLGIGDMKKLVSEITQFEPIVLNSHTHIDHVGGNYQFQVIYGMDTEFTRVNAKGTPHEEAKELLLAEGSIWKKTPPGFEPEKFVSHPFSITKIVQNGEKIDLGDRTLEVIFTPGHTPDSICLIDRKNRLLCTGDSFYPAPIYAYGPGSDFHQFSESAAHLAGLRPELDYLLTGHNETLLESAYLVKLKEAFLAIESNKIPYTVKDSLWEYSFDRFSILIQPQKKP
jgi:glyoxylase-like metal-dependent hydrolase (beta-lactamase superfamily II)